MPRQLWAAAALLLSLLDFAVAQTDVLVRHDCNRDVAGVTFEAVVFSDPGDIPELDTEDSNRCVRGDGSRGGAITYSFGQSIASAQVTLFLHLDNEDSLWLVAGSGERLDFPSDDVLSNARAKGYAPGECGSITTSLQVCRVDNSDWFEVTWSVDLSDSCVEELVINLSGSPQGTNPIAIGQVILRGPSDACSGSSVNAGVIVGVVIAVIVVVAVVLGLWFWRRRRKRLAQNDKIGQMTEWQSTVGGSSQQPQADAGYRAGGDNHQNPAFVGSGVPVSSITTTAKGDLHKELLIDSKASPSQSQMSQTSSQQQAQQQMYTQLSQLQQQQPQVYYQQRQQQYEYQQPPMHQTQQPGYPAPAHGMQPQGQQQQQQQQQPYDRAAAPPGAAPTPAGVALPVATAATAAAAAGGVRAEREPSVAGANARRRSSMQPAPSFADVDLPELPPDDDVEGPSVEEEGDPDQQLLLQEVHMRQAAGITQMIQGARENLISQQTLKKGPTTETELEVLERVGGGGFGEVFKGNYKGDIVAVKVMKIKPGAKQEALTELPYTEAAIAGICVHPNIVQTMCSDLLPVFINSAAERAWKQGGRNFANVQQKHVKEWNVRMVMEMCDLGSVRDWVSHAANQEHGPLYSSVPKKWGHHGCGRTLCALLTALDVARGMKLLHKYKILHGDLKPHNVLLVSNRMDPRGFVAKLSDFGLSMKMAVHDGKVSGIKYGTVQYLAHEVLKTHVMTTKADVYSFGIIMWEVWHSRLFAEFYNLEKKKRREQGRTMDSYRPIVSSKCPPDYVKLMNACLHWDPEERPDFLGGSINVAHELERLTYDEMIRLQRI